MKQNEPVYFSWSDAWVLTSIYYSKREGPLDLPKIIASGDMLNHAILLKEEINTAFLKFINRGILEIIDKHLIFTSLGKEIIEKAEKRKGGLFSRVDCTFKVLVLYESKLPTMKMKGRL